MNTFISLMVGLFLLGLMLGSFLNVCVYRLPKDESVLFGRSYCPNCHETIAWHDNIPLLSYIFLGGRCRHCGAGIPLGEPAWELVSGLILLGCGIWWYRSGSLQWINFSVCSAFILICLTASRIDLHESIIPNEINYLFTVSGLGLGFVTHYPLSVGSDLIFNPGQFIVSLVGAVVGGGFFFTLAVISPLIYGKPALGMGDVKLMAGVGAWLGARLVVFTIAVGSMFGALIGTGLMLYQGKSLRTEIPFGPFLCMGAVLGLVAGDPIINWYLNLL
ncbi:MAG: A24 family peptidase [bacterium]